ncbi:hypothetical protein [Litoreibacter arenae]|uniref:Lipoprotein, putative n=1 Tax=Litoreibacter arenae DSM 19593 TaxID=1123360 RepID=S9QJP4_9RHOB|nr:hypothetical protein [Litoreibacter arenae]EPX81651.1 lipoprotein, putative [Litoreibacter arenae DSM 19593]
MRPIKAIIAVAALGALTACTGENNGGDKTRDYGSGLFGRGTKDLSQLQAGIWVDPRGCDHWIIDDGIEGYLSARLDRNGKPVCSGAAPPGYATGNYRGSDDVRDPI